MRARPEGPNPSGPVQHGIIIAMKKKVLVEKKKFDAVLSALLKSKPKPRKNIKTSGKRGAKTPMFQKPLES